MLCAHIHKSAASRKSIADGTLKTFAKLPEVHRREVRQEHVAGSGREAIVGAEKSRPSAAGEFARKSLAENSRLKILVAGEFGRIIIRRRMRAFYIVSRENHHRGSSVFKSLL